MSNDAIEIFAPATLAGIPLRNRFVRSAQGAGDPDDQIAPLTELIDGEVGLIISGHSYVIEEGRAGAGQTAINRDECIPGLARLTAAIHGRGGKIVSQLAHAGVAAGIDGIPLGPSEFTLPKSGKVARAMTDSDLDRTKSAFIAAAVRAKNAGFDGVQIHAAHGFLLSQFLSPYFNRRTDNYGGTLENRARLLLEIVDGIRAAVNGFPVMVKLNSQDYLENGLTADDALAVGLLLEKHGIDAIEISGGTIFSPAGLGPGQTEEPSAPPYFREAASRFRSTLTRPTILLVGGVRSPETAARLVNEGATDFISLCRPLMREPGLIRRWRQESGKLY